MFLCHIQHYWLWWVFVFIGGGSHCARDLLPKEIWIDQQIDRQTRGWTDRLAVSRPALAFGDASSERPHPLSHRELKTEKKNLQTSSGDCFYALK